MLKQIPTTIRQHQLTIPLVSLVLATVAYSLPSLISHNLTSLTTIGPCIAMVACWIGLSASPGKGRVAILITTLAWMFVLWYAFPSPTEIPSINFWAYQASFATIAGSAIVMGILLRIVTRFRFTASAGDQEWTTAARWGLFDLLLLTFGGALMVSAASAGRIALFISDPWTVCIASSVVASAMTILAFGFWVALSQRGWSRVVYLSVVTVASCWVFSIAENFSLRSTIVPMTHGYLPKGYLQESLIRFDLPTIEGATRFFSFALALGVPTSCGIVFGNRLISLHDTVGKSKPSRVLERIASALITIALIVACVFLSQARWSTTSSDDVALHRAGWPIYFHESSARINQAGVATNVHLQTESTSYRLANLLIALVPLPILLWIWSVRRKSSDNSNRGWIPFWTVPAAYLIAVYVAPGSISQRAVDRALQLPRDFHSHSISWLTQRTPDSRHTSRSDRAYVTSDEALKQLLRMPGGARVRQLRIENTHLTADDLALLASDHCLRELNLRSCTWDGNLSALSESARLEIVRLKELEVADADVVALSRCRTIVTLQLEQIEGANWERWPKNLRELWITLGDAPQETWRFENLPRLTLLVMESQPQWERLVADPHIHRDPIRIQFRRCGSLGLLIDTALPVHLSFESTKLTGLAASYGMRRAGAPKVMPRFVDLRSFKCDDVSKLVQFEACVADCESFECSLPSGVGPKSRAKIILDGMRRVRMPEELYFSRGRFGPLADPSNDDQSAQIVNALAASVAPNALIFRGMTFDPQLLSSVRNPNWVESLEFHLPIDGDAAVALVETFPSLRSLSIPKCVDRRFAPGRHFEGLSDARVPHHSRTGSGNLRRFESQLPQVPGGSRKSHSETE